MPHLGWGPSEQERSKQRREYFREYARNRDFTKLRVGDRIRNIEWRFELREKAINKLGGKCCKCGYYDHRALQIDHINGGGSKELKSMSRSTYLNKIIKGETKAYQLLCANCNWIKRYENNEVKNQYRKGVN